MMMKTPISSIHRAIRDWSSIPPFGYKLFWKSKILTMSKILSRSREKCYFSRETRNREFSWEIETRKNVAFLSFFFRFLPFFFLFFRFLSFSFFFLSFSFFFISHLVLDLTRSTDFSSRFEKSKSRSWLLKSLQGPFVEYML